MNKKPLWMIWDCVTGSVDGFYFDKDIAENVFNMLKEEGCTSIMLCEIKKRPRGSRFSFWGDRWGSNPRMPDSQSGVLTTSPRSPWMLIYLTNLLP